MLRELRLANLSEKFRIVRSECFTEVDYIIDDTKQQIIIDTEKNGKLAIRFDTLKEFLSELGEVNQVLCLKGEV